MNYCRQCGKPLDGPFCTACGTDYSETPPNTYSGPVYNTPPAYPPYGYQPQKPPVSVGGWIGRMLVPLIPVVGSIAYLIMLIVWMGDESKDDTFRNWAKAQLIVMLISVGIVVVSVFFLIFLVGMSFATLSPAYYY